MLKLGFDVYRSAQFIPLTNVSSRCGARSGRVPPETSSKISTKPRWPRGGKVRITRSRSKKNIWTAPPLPRTMWVSNMHFLSSGYFRQKSWTQGMSFCMATDGYSDGCAIDLTRLRLLACWTAPWHQPHASNTTRVPPVETPLWLHKIKDFTHLLRH